VKNKEEYRQFKQAQVTNLRESGAGQVGYEMYQDNWNYGYNAQLATSEVAGGTIGGIGGAIIGAKIGVWFWGWGAIPGGIIGGIIGGWGGSEAGGATYRQIKK